MCLALAFLQTRVQITPRCWRQHHAPLGGFIS